MKTRIFSNWTFRRVFYLIVGIFLLVQAIASRQWFGVLFGTYFASMGLFAFGCAGFNCYTKQTTSSATKDVEFEEIK